MLKGFAIEGNVEVIVSDETGVIQIQRIKNLVVARGVEIIRDRIMGTGTFASTSVSHFSVGKSNTAVSSAQVNLVDPVTGYTRGSLVKTAGSGVAIFSYTLPSGDANGNTLTEIGLFTASTGDTLFARALLATAIVKDATKQVAFEWRINIAVS